MMDDLRLPAVAARLVAWHNRHPLARRIAAAQVHAVGYVGLPFVGAAGAAARPTATPAAADVDADAVAPADAVAVAADAAAPEAGSLRDRALARARHPASAPGAVLSPEPVASDAPMPALATLLPDFSEDFIDPLRPRAVARFAAKVGQVLGRPPGDGPVRQIAADAAHPGCTPARVYLLTAVIETDTRKSRVLLGTGLSAPVLGQRLLSTPRLLGVAALAALVVGVPTWLLRPGDVPQAAAPAPQAALGAASAASAAASAAAPGVSTAASGPVAAIEAAEASAPAESPGAAVSAAHAGTDDAHPAAAVALAASGRQVPAASAPAAAQALPPMAGTRAPATPSIRPLLSDADKAAARQARQRAGSAPGAATIAAPDTAPDTAPVATPAAVPPTAAPKPPVLPMPAPAARTAPQPLPAPPQRTAAPAAAQAQPPAGTSAFALSTRALRTRAEAEQVMVAMRALLRTVGAADVKVDVLPQGDDWRVVGWPFPRRADADKARALLVSRGMRVEVVDF